MTTKRYTVQEANDLLPYLASALVELRDKYAAAEEIRAEIARRSSGNGHGQDENESSATLARVSELIDRITEWQIELRDLDTGLVDFPALLDGDDVWLCWRLGEPEVVYWHAKDQGFAARRPLP